MTDRLRALLAVSVVAGLIVMGASAARPPGVPIKCWLACSQFSDCAIYCPVPPPPATPYPVPVRESE